MSSDQNQDSEHMHATETPEQSLAKVQELLFGNQSRNLEQRCEQLQDQMTESYNALRNEISEQIGQLQQTLRDEIASVRGQVTGEQAERRQELENLGNRLDQKIVEQAGELQNRIGGVNDELRTYTLNQTQHLWDDLQSRYDNLSSRMDQEIGDVRNAAAQRSSLGDMFREMASRLEEHSQAEQR